MRASTLTAIMLAILVVAVPAAAQDARRVTLMSYNVENLFDTQDNPAREGDNTYLPLALKARLRTRICASGITRRAHAAPNVLTLDWRRTSLTRRSRISPP